VSSRIWSLRVQDILEAIDSIQRQTTTLQFEEFTQNPILVKAVLYDFIVIGEAALNVPSDVKDQYPSIPWRLMGDMRNVIAHEYFQINLVIVWNTIQNNLPPLVAQLREVLQFETEQNE